MRQYSEPRELVRISGVRECCQVILVRSRGEASLRYPDRMGVYTAQSSLSGRLVYQHVSSQGLLYYYDWGPNSGTNWMFGDQSGESYRQARLCLMYCIFII